MLTILGTVLHPPQIEFDMNIHQAYPAHILVSVDLGRQRTVTEPIRIIN